MTNTLNHKPQKPTEDPMKTLVREVIDSGRDRKEFKRSVKKHLIKSPNDPREVISKRIKESHERIDRYWFQILAETNSEN